MKYIKSFENSVPLRKDVIDIQLKYSSRLPRIHGQFVPISEPNLRNFLSELYKISDQWYSCLVEYSISEYNKICEDVKNLIKNFSLSKEDLVYIVQTDLADITDREFSGGAFEWECDLSTVDNMVSIVMDCIDDYCIENNIDLHDY